MIIGEISPYPYHYITSRKVEEPRISTLVFGFRDKSRLRYLVDVECYPHNLYAIKFYVHKQSGQASRFCHMTNKGYARSIIHTCIQIGVDIWRENQLASFCFIGAPTLSEYANTKYKETKRFRAYGLASRFLLSPDVFEHHTEEKQSAYFLINRQAKEKNPTIVKDMLEMFEKNYTLENFYPDLDSAVTRSLGGSISSGDKRKKNQR